MTWHSTVVGRMARDPEMKSATMSTGALAHQERSRQDDGTWQDDGPVTWVEIVAYDDMVDMLAACRRGDLVEVSGPTELREWQGRDGQTRWSPRIRRIESIGIRRRRATDPQPQPQPQAPQQSPWVQQPQQPQQQPLADGGAWQQPQTGALPW